MKNTDEYINKLISEQNSLHRIAKLHEDVRVVYENLHPRHDLYSSDLMAKRLIDEHRTIQEISKSFDVVRDALEIDKYIDRIRGAISQPEALFNQTESILKNESLNYAADLLSQFDYINKYATHFNSFTNDIYNHPSFGNIFKNYLNNVADNILLNEQYLYNFISEISSLKGFFDNSLIDDYIIQNDGILIINNQAVTAFEIKTSINEFLPLLRKKQKKDRFKRYLNKQTRPSQKFLLNIIIQLFYAIVGAFIQPIIEDKIYGVGKAVTETDIKRIVKECIQEERYYKYDNYRIVTCMGLRLRIEPSMKARIIETLELGKIVKVIKKNKNWSFVEVGLRDHSEAVYGWVNTRYIKKVEVE